MRARITLPGVLFCLLLAGPVGNAAEKPDPNVATAAFGRLATLAGEWKSESGKESITYELIAGGSTILEREVGEGRPPMLTLYHRDGDRLLLTHYCMAGNQPRMVARSYDPATGELAFDFLDATNLPSTAAGHMRSVKIRFVDANHIESEWQFYENGKAKFTERFRYARVR